MKSLLVCFFIFSSVLVRAGDEVVSPDGFWSERWNEFQSPWTTKTKKYFLWGIVATGTLAIFEDVITDPVQAETIENKPLGSASVIGDVAGQGVPNLLYVIGMGGSYLWNKEESSYFYMMTMLKSSIYSAGMAHVLKYAVRENRPDNHSGSRYYDSFPSGHTTSAFAFASTVVALHGWKPYGILATSLATLTAFSRINDNRHYFHDVIGGIVLGAGYGFGISFLQKDKSGHQASAKSGSLKLAIVPNIQPGYQGLNLASEF